MTSGVIPPFQIVGAARDGEGRIARIINFTPDLGAPDGPGNIPSVADVTITISRQDLVPIQDNDISVLPSLTQLDPTGYILLVWFNVPIGLPYYPGSTTITYVVTFNIQQTASGQGYERDGLLVASSLLG
jgi:hypothetical protein